MAQENDSPSMARNAITAADFNISDGEANITKSQTISFDFRSGILASSNIAKATISHLELIENKITGSSYLVSYIDTNSSTKNILLAKKEDDRDNIAEKDLKVELKASSSSTATNELIEVRIYHPDKGDFLSLSEFNKKFYIYEHNGSAGRISNTRVMLKRH